MSDVSATPPPAPPAAAVATAAAPVATTAVAVEIIKQDVAVLPATIQTTQIVAIEKAPASAVLLTLQTAQGSQVVVKADRPQLTDFILGQTVQLKLPNATSTGPALAQILLSPTITTQAPALPITAPVPAAVMLPTILPNTTLPPLNSVLVVAQTLPQILNAAQLPQLLTADLGPPTLQNLLQQLQLLPQTNIRENIGAAISVPPTLLPQVLQQGLTSFLASFLTSVQNNSLTLPLETKIQQFLAQNNFGVTPLPTPTLAAPILPHMQTSPLALLANTPVFNSPQASQLIVNQPLPRVVGGLVQQVLLPGVVNGQPLATPFSASMLQQLQPMLVLGQVPQNTAITLGLKPTTALALMPQGVVALPPNFVAPTLPGTLLLLQSPTTILKDFYLSLAPQLGLSTPQMPAVTAPQLMPTMSGLPNLIDMPFTLGAPWDAGNVLWQGLEKLGLLQTLPSLATPNLSQVPSLPLALMQIFGAFKKQDMSAWLGADAVAVLTKTTEGRKLLATFDQASKTHRQATQETWRDGWQPLPLPLMQDDKWQILPLFYRHQENQQNADKNSDDNAQKKQGGRTTRFLVQMPQTAWGQMQLDGFLQLAAKPQEPTQLDMVLRTEQPLAEHLKHGLVERYSQVLGALGYVGQIICQTALGHNHVVLQPQHNAVEVQG